MFTLPHRLRNPPADGPSQMALRHGDYRPPESFERARKEQADRIAQLERDVRDGRVLSGVKLAGRDLRRAKLAGALLAGADLARADLCECDLSGADLRGADLSSATLLHANLARARLDNANLEGANLAEAVLLDASLRDARLFTASLRGAKVDGADFSGADIEGADITDTSIPHPGLTPSKVPGCQGGVEPSEADAAAVRALVTKYGEVRAAEELGVSEMLLLRAAARFALEADDLLGLRSRLRAEGVLREPKAKPRRAA
jgi:hypothetical protein